MAIKRNSPQQTHTVTALILAGGAGRRMEGQDKGLLKWQSKPLIEHIISRLPEGIDKLLISCNRNLEQYQKYAATVVDEYPDYQGPLAGIYAALTTITTSELLVLPCDCPRPPRDLLRRLSEQRDTYKADVCFAHDGGRGQYLFALLNTTLKANLGSYLASGGRSVNQWYKQLHSVQADFSDQADAFRNINLPSDMPQP